MKPQNLLYINYRLSIPLSEIEFRRSRSSGPGGQHANVTESRVEVVFDVTASESLSGTQKQRVIEKLGPIVVAVAQDHRSQLRNRELALTRLADRLRAALRRPTVRKPTTPSAAANRRRLESKKRHSDKKQQRRPPID